MIVPKYFIAFVLLTLGQINIVNAGWVEVTGVASTMYLSSKEAEEKALDNARLEAVKSMGFDISASTFSQKTESGTEMEKFFNSISNSTSRGIIVEEKIISSGSEKFIRDDGREVLHFKVTIKANVKKMVSDENLSLKMEMNQENFGSGENVVLKCWANFDAHLTLFNFTEEGDIYVLSPSTIFQKRQIKELQTIEIPTLEERKRGMVLSVELPEGKTNTTERFLLVGSKKNLPFKTSLGDKINGVVVIPKSANGFIEINKWLLDLGSQKVNLFKIFQIFKK